MHQEVSFFSLWGYNEGKMRQKDTEKPIVQSPSMLCRAGMKRAKVDSKIDSRDSR